MDIEEYYDSIHFTLVGKEKGFYIYEARVNTGDESLVRVISANRATRLKDMRWKKLWGLDMQKSSVPLRLQSFFPEDRFAKIKTLYLENEDAQKTVFMSANQPYTVTIPRLEGYESQYDDDRVTLVEVIGSPQFEVRRFD